MDSKVELPGLLDTLAGDPAGLRAMLHGKDAVLLSRRPPNYHWSVVENVKHLVFTGLGHMGQYVPELQDWGRFGLEVVPPPPKFSKQVRLRDGGSIEALLDAWQAVLEFAAPRLLARDSPELRHHLSRHIRHQRQHIQEIGRLLKRLPA
jgi:hypothetical protein